MTEVLKAPSIDVPEARSIRWNPPPSELRELTAAMPNARRTLLDNYNVQTRVVSRSKASTFVVTDTPEDHSDKTMTRAEYIRMAALQDAHIKDRDMVVIDGYIGNDPDYRVRTRLYIDVASANIAGQYAFYGFAAMGIGGFGSFFGAIAGGLLVGLVANVPQVWISPNWSDFLIYVFMLVVLLFRPQGLFGSGGTAFGASALRDV